MPSFHNSHYEKFLATGEVKCIDEEIPFEIPAGWEWCRLNDLALYRKGPFGSSLTKSMFVARSNQSFKVYEQKNAIQKDFRLGDYYISKEKFEAMQSFIVKPNDIIVSCAGTIGETYLLPLDAPAGIINQALMKVTLFDLSMAEYWQMYFAYMLLNEVQMKGAGSAIKNIPPFEYLKAVLVPVPPLSEQNRLVERYNLLLSLIAKYESDADKLNRLNLNIYDKLKKTILQEAIQGKLVKQIAAEGTAQELLEQMKAEKQKLVKEGKLKKKDITDSVIFKGDDNRHYEKIGGQIIDISEDIPFDIPDSWSWVRVSSIAKLISGTSYDKGDVTAKGIRILRGTNIVNFSVEFKDDDVFLPLNYFDGEKIISDGDIVIVGSTGSFTAIGRPAFIHGTHLYTQIGAFLRIVRSFSDLTNLWLAQIFKSQYYRSCIADRVKGTSINNIKAEYILNMLVPLPPYNEQRRIVQRINELFTKL